MRNSLSYLKAVSLIFIVLFFCSCTKQDQSHWEQVAPSDSFFSGIIVNALYFDDKGKCWAGTDTGLFILKNEEIIESYTTVDGLPSNFITSISQDSKDRIWIGTRESGVACRKGKEWQTFTIEDGLADDHVTCFHLRDNGDLWIGTDDAVSVYSNGVWSKYRIVNKKWNHYPTDLEEAGDGRIWVTLGWISGINVYDPGLDTWVHYGTNVGLPTDYFTSASFGRGKMWLGTDAFGVITYDGSTWENYTVADGLINDHVNDVLVDSRGIVWVGTNNGLSRFNGNTWESLTTENSGIPGNRVNVIAEDPEGRIWFGTNNGIGIYSEETRDILLFP